MLQAQAHKSCLGGKEKAFCVLVVIRVRVCTESGYKGYIDNWIVLCHTTPVWMKGNV